MAMQTKKNHTLIERPLPVVDQVLNIIRRRIFNDYYAGDNRLPSENDLAAELGVSRATVRSALTILETEMLISRRQGDGTYINERLLNTTNNLGKILEFTKHIEASGFKPSIKPLYLVHKTASMEEAKALKIETSGEVLAIGRLFYADQFPAILSHNTIPADLLCREITLQDLDQSLPVFFKRFCNLTFTYGITDLLSVLPDEETKQLLEIDHATPVMLFTETFFSKEDQPLVFALNYYNDKRVNLRVARLFF
jgi:GntR family transcriptional regulator